MMPKPDQNSGHGQHAFTYLNPRVREGLNLYGRRGILKASLAGMAGLSLPELLRARVGNPKAGSDKAVILLWMTGGPSHIDAWDPKPEAPWEIRGPFSTIPTKLPGVRLSEHYPLQAKMMDKLTLIRSMVCKGSMVRSRAAKAKPSQRQTMNTVRVHWTLAV